MNIIGKQTYGMVLGKFMPPHLGHVYLVEFARNYVDHLSVVVGTIAAEPIDGALRYQWMHELFPDLNVIHLTDENPQQPSEHPDFWQIWQNSLTRVLPAQIDYVFASEDYGWRLAEILGAQFIPVDRERSVVPISATAIRNDPWRYWQYLPVCVRPYYAKRVCIFGPESTGKSTLAKDLAEYFHTVRVTEYARTLLEAQQGKIVADDIERIARGQSASEAAMVKQCNRVLFCDTDLLTTVIWSETLFGDCSQWIRDAAKNSRYDLYLLTDIDVPWISDQVRYLPSQRAEFYQRCLQELQSRGLPFVKISGSWNERFDTAVKAVEELFL